MLKSTKFLCPKYCIPRSPSRFACIRCNFGLSGSEYSYRASLVPLLQDIPDLSHAKMSAAQVISAISRLKSSSHLGIPSPFQFPATSSLQFPVAPSLVLVFAGSIETDESCVGNVEDEVVVELDDSPGSTKGSVFGFEGGLLLVLRQYGRSVLEQLHSDDKCRACTQTCASHSSGPRLHFTTGRHQHGWVLDFRVSSHLS